MKLGGMIGLMVLAFIFVSGCNTPGKIMTYIEERPHKNPKFEDFPISAENMNVPKEKILEPMSDKYKITVKLARAVKKEKFADWILAHNQGGGGLEIENILKAYRDAFEQFGEILKYENKFGVRVLPSKFHISRDECKLYNLLSYGESEDIQRALKTDDFELIKVITKPSYFKQIYHTCEYFLEKD